MRNRELKEERETSDNKQRKVSRKEHCGKKASNLYNK
jgi:hypothetical protein